MNPRRSTRLNPFFDFGQIPRDASGGERNAARKFAPLLHVEDRALTQRNHRMELFAVDKGFGPFLRFPIQTEYLALEYHRGLIIDPKYRVLPALS